MMNRCIYLFCWRVFVLLVQKPRIRLRASLVGDPGTGRENLIHSDWYARKANEVKMDGNRLSAGAFE